MSTGNIGLNATYETLSHFRDVYIPFVEKLSFKKSRVGSQQAEAPEEWIWVSTSSPYVPVSVHPQRAQRLEANHREVWRHFLMLEQHIRKNILDPAGRQRVSACRGCDEALQRLRKFVREGEIETPCAPPRSNTDEVPAKRPPEHSSAEGENADVGNDEGRAKAEGRGKTGRSAAMQLVSDLQNALGDIERKMSFGGIEQQVLQGALESEKPPGTDDATRHVETMPSFDDYRRCQVDFCTPPGASWEDVAIVILSDTRAKLTVKDVTVEASFAELGFVDRRKTEPRPNAYWHTLRKLAMHKGVISWDSKDYAPRKRIQGVRFHLRDIFGIDGDPFLPYSRDRGYAARFKVQEYV